MLPLWLKPLYWIDLLPLDRDKLKHLSVFILNVSILMDSEYFIQIDLMRLVFFSIWLIVYHNMIIKYLSLLM